MARKKSTDSEQAADSGVPQLAIEGELTIYCAAEMKPRIAGLLEEIAASPASRGAIDLAQVSEIDSAGLQLLLLARREAAARGVVLELCNPSQAVSDCLALCNLAAEFGAGELAA
jgi:anti-anti-sigma factor